MQIKTQIKCVIWDLDNTIWEGVLLEDDITRIKENITVILEQLDERGILNSIASKNNYNDAIQRLEELGIRKYFLYPQIGWEPKSVSIGKIQRQLNIRMDSILFVDDDLYEREEVKSVFPEIQCMDARDYFRISEVVGVDKIMATDDAKKRRLFYENMITRGVLEEKYVGPKIDFLKSLNMELNISIANSEQLKRCQELTMRTSQLNSTGILYTEDELIKMINRENMRVLVAELKDRIGSYGIVSLVILNLEKDKWRIKLLITSCRVISRGIANIILYYIMNLAQKEDKYLVADFIDTGKNRNMYITYKFCGFEEKKNTNGLIELVNRLEGIPKVPDYIKVNLMNSIL